MTSLNPVTGPVGRLEVVELGDVGEEEELRDVGEEDVELGDVGDNSDGRHIDRKR